MNVRALLPIAAATGLWLSGPAIAQQPATPASTSSNQSLAEAVATRLRDSGITAGAEIAIKAQDGQVILVGTTRDSAQKERVIHEVRQVPGVTLVRDGVKVGSVVQVRGSEGEHYPMPIPPGGPAPGNPIVEPAPLGIPGQFTPDMQAPGLPPYAWPTYAPYNNVSRVAYPGSYPYNAFPFIGPF